MERDLQLEYETLLDELPVHIPELRRSYEAELTWWGTEEPEPHVIFASVVNPYLDRLLESDNRPALARAFDFLELLSRHADQRVQDLVLVTVCEHLGGNAKHWRAARQFMGPVTRKHCDELEKSWAAPHGPIDV
jgi:hypothetical protein